MWHYEEGRKTNKLCFLFVYIALETSFAVTDNLSACIKKSNNKRHISCVSRWLHSHMVYFHYIVIQKTE